MIFAPVLLSCCLVVSPFVPPSKIAIWFSWGAAGDILVDRNVRPFLPARIPASPWLIIVIAAWPAIRKLPSRSWWPFSRCVPSPLIVSPSGRDFAYVSRDRVSRRYHCHVFRCEQPARHLANTLCSLCKHLVLERKRRQALKQQQHQQHQQQMKSHQQFLGQQQQPPPTQRRPMSLPGVSSIATALDRNGDRNSTLGSCERGVCCEEVFFIDFLCYRGNDAVIFFQTEVQLCTYMQRRINNSSFNQLLFT